MLRKVNQLCLLGLYQIPQAQQNPEQQQNLNFFFFLKLDINVQYNFLIYRMCGDFFNSILKSNTFQNSSEEVYILIISLREALVVVVVVAASL